MVEINNQRKAFPRYAGVNWRTGWTMKIKIAGYDVIVGGELLRYSDHPRKLVTLNWLNQAPDATSFFPVGAGCLPQTLG